MDSDSGGEKRLISVRARGGEINECRDVICNICMVGSSYWGCDYEKTTTRNMDIISGLGCSRNYGNMDEIAEAVRGVANLWSIPVADQHAKSGINSATSSIYLSDNVHPNDEGGKKVANVWVNALKSNAELIN